MRKHSLAFVFLLFLLGACRADGGFYPPRHPWHFADVWWTCTAATAGVSEIAIDFRVTGRIDDTFDLYVAPLGLVRINATAFYGGVQTSADGWPDKEARTKRRIGRGGIFSRWSADDTPIALEYAAGEAGTHFESADYEKNFISVRRKVDWAEGDYSFRVRRLPGDSDATVPHAWFGASVVDKRTGEETAIGALRLDGTAFVADKTIAAFVEVYRRSSIPRVSVAFSEPRFDGRPCASSQVKAVYPKYGASDAPRFASAVRLGDVVVVTTLPAGTRDGLGEEILR